MKHNLVVEEEPGSFLLVHMENMDLEIGHDFHIAVLDRAAFDKMTDFHKLP